MKLLKNDMPNMAVIDKKSLDSNIGNKVGGGIKAKNIVLEKNNGRTRISVSTDSPVVHMQKELAKAQAEARKFKF